MHQLIIQDSAGDVIVVPLMHARVSLGRAKGNVVRLTDQNVSRRHARLIRQNGRYVIEDLDSYLGTQVNGETITAPRLLADDDQVTIGDYRFAVKVPQAFGAAARSFSLVPSSQLEDRPSLRARARKAAAVGAAAAARARSTLAGWAKALSPGNVAALLASIKMVVLRRQRAGLAGDGSADGVGGWRGATHARGPHRFARDLRTGSANPRPAAVGRTALGETQGHLGATSARHPRAGRRRFRDGGDRRSVRSEGQARHRPARARDRSGRPRSLRPRTPRPPRFSRRPTRPTDSSGGPMPCH